MRDTIHLEPKQVPANLVGGYKGRKFKMRVTDSVTLANTYWDGGSRDSYTLVELATGKRSAAPGNPSPSQFGGNQSGKTIELKPGYAIIEHSIFRGKDMGLTFHVHPDNATKLLPPKADVSDDVRTVLKYSSALKNTYGGRTNIRYTKANRETGITADRWEVAKSQAIELGYMRKNGAVTPQGRNAS